MPASTPGAPARMRIRAKPVRSSENWALEAHLERDTISQNLVPGLGTSVPALYSHDRRCSMFESLADRIKADEQQQSTTRERAVLYTVVAILSMALFAGLYFVVGMAS